MWPQRNPDARGRWRLDVQLAKWSGIHRKVTWHHLAPQSQQWPKPVGFHRFLVLMVFVKGVSRIQSRTRINHGTFHGGKVATAQLMARGEDAILICKESWCPSVHPTVFSLLTFQCICEWTLMNNTHTHITSRQNNMSGTSCRPTGCRSLRFW